jgi:hypothetical protein
MRKKAEILRRLRDLEHDLSEYEIKAEPLPNDARPYLENLGRVKALNWVLNRE